jgi:hypothetical protein
MADIYSIPIFVDEVITASGSAQSQTYPVSAYKPLGNFASQLHVTGEVSVDLYTSINGEDFVFSRTLFDGYATGQYLENHGMEVANHFYIKVTDTSGTGSTMSHWLSIQ